VHRLIAVHRRRQPGEGNIRRWIIENDYSKGVVHGMVIAKISADQPFRFVYFTVS
jgi:hypothetical protein